MFPIDLLRKVLEPQKRQINHIRHQVQAVHGKDPAIVQEPPKDDKPDPGVVHGPLVPEGTPKFAVPLLIGLLVAGASLHRRLELIQFRLLLGKQSA